MLTGGPGTEKTRPELSRREGADCHQTAPAYSTSLRLRLHGNSSYFRFLICKYKVINTHVYFFFTQMQHILHPVLTFVLLYIFSISWTLFYIIPYSFASFFPVVT